MIRLPSRRARCAPPHIRRASVVVLLLAVLVLFAGCASPRALFCTAADSYVAAVNAAFELNERGLLTPEQERQIDVWERVAHGALKGWGEALRSDKPTEAYVRAFYDALEALTLVLLETEGEPADAEGDNAAEGRAGSPGARAQST